jgi:AcrR family transcriptional regulator
MPRISSHARRALVEERKSQILAAAAKVFARKGYERATIAEIAKEAGVAEGSIYNYFKNKSDLLVSVPRQFVQPAVETVSLEFTRAPVGASGAPEQLLTFVARNLIATVTHNIDLFRVFLSALPTMSASARQKYLEQVPLLAFGVLETYFRQQIEAGVFRRDLDPAVAARMFPGMLIPFVVIQEMLQPPPAVRLDYDEVIAQVVRLFLRGALADASDNSRERKRR